MNVELQLRLRSWTQTVLPGLNMPSCHQRPFLHRAKLQRKSNVTRGRSKKAKTTPAQHTSKAKCQQAVKTSKGKPYKHRGGRRNKGSLQAPSRSSGSVLSVAQLCKCRPHADATRENSREELADTRRDKTRHKSGGEDVRPR